MSLPSLKQVARSPTGGLAAGLVAALLLASLASAGLNTIWVARALLLLSFSVFAAYVWLSETAATMSRRERVTAILVAGMALLLLERVETWQRSKPEHDQTAPHLPVPPLMLMLHSRSDFFTEPVTTPVPNQRLAVSYVSLPQGGYAGFADNEWDDPMLGIPDVEFVNLSNEPLTITWTLTVVGEGVSFTSR